MSFRDRISSLWAQATWRKRYISYLLEVIEDLSKQVCVLQKDKAELVNLVEYLNSELMTMTEPVEGDDRDDRDFGHIPSVDGREAYEVDDAVGWGEVP